MNDPDYFFLIFVATIALARLFLLAKKPRPAIKGFRLRHYMYGLVLIAAAFLFENVEVYAVGFGLLVDEVPVILVKGPGHKDEHWRGCEDYHSQWNVAGVLMLITIVFIFRQSILALI